ncbi:HVO_2072 family ArtA-dependent S-layer glycoprotein [Halorubrum yunnanense]|uniref:Cell surface glycoprotein n=1 Tax=Halorubrum yunnanense TaxID=1526162 RepID=A0ABD5YID2_9EURY|nr:HVO_2072 family ArtA-dependent S-layer glycoprotein [Halorubrum yunnanense]
MTNDNNTRSKANAVFFSVIMVISMVAVGFAAAPAAAVDGSNSEVTFNDQVEESGNVAVDVNSYFDGAGSDAAIVLTYENSSGTPIIAGINSSTGISDGGGGSVSVATDNDTGVPGELTAHLFNQSTVGGFSAGVDDPAPQTGVLTDTAFVTTSSQAQRSAGSNNAFDGSSIYQGEDTINFIPPNASVNGGTIDAQDLSGTAGNREGSPLQLPIPNDENTGTYDLNGPTDGDGGFSVNVVEPRITTSEVQLTGSGNDVSQVGPTAAENLKIFAEWNFGDAENLAITVEDPNGDDITGEVLTNDPDGNGQDVISYGENESGEDASVGLDLSSEDAGAYTVIFEGNDELDQSGVVEEYTIELTNEDDLTLEMAEDSVTQGSNTGYTVSGGTDGDVRVVAIEESAWADEVSQTDAEDVFRNVQDVNEADSTRDYAYALVEIDGTTAAGSIDTGLLDTSDVTVEVYGVDDITQVDDDNLEDDDDFEVVEGELALDSPTGDYVIGSEVDVNGSAEAADQVQIYALNNDDWERVQIGGQPSIDVDSDDTFEVEDVQLNQGSSILSLPGRYNIGVIDAEDGDRLGPEINTSAWSSNDGTRASINVQAGDLSGNFGTINGQFAVEDSSISVEGAAEGQDEVVVAFVGERGTTDVDTISVDNDGTFDEEDVDVSDLDQGAASAHIISVGRDSTVGDGVLPDANSSQVSVDPTGELRDFIDELDDSNSLTGNQVRDRIVAQTTEADATDDLMVSTTFRVTEGSVSIDSVYPEEAQADGVNPVATGETMVIEGSTNFQPDDNSIVLEVLNQNSNSVDSVSVDEWENDGQFSVTMDTTDLETGTYTLEADTGDATDSVAIEIVEERQDPDDGSDGDDGSTDGDDGSTDGDDGSTDGDDGSTDGDDGSTDGDDGSTDGDDGGSDGDDGGTDDSTPGFGALVALVALVAAALLATRRND